MSRRMAVVVANFALGGCALVAQATLLREAQVLVFGSELAWGLVLAFWLAGVAAGAAAGGRLVGRPGHPRRPLAVFATAGLAMPACLAAVVALARGARLILGVGPGEYVGPGAMVLVSLLATVPVSLWIGLAFPAASALLGDSPAAGARGAAPGNAGTAGAGAAGPHAAKARAVGWVYLAESAGGLVGGVLFSFVLVGRVGAMPLAAGAGVVLALAVAMLARACAARPGWQGAALALAAAEVLLLASGLSGRYDDATVRLRWRSFAPGLELVRSLDTRYQNVAIGRLGDQFSLFANGIVAATWPNHAELAVTAHLAACEQPDPRRMLLLGGGTEGLVKELLRYRPERLDYVTLDERLLAAVREHLDPPDRAALDALPGGARAAIAGGVHFADARWYVKRAAARGERYDLVILAAPEPASTLEARLYTEEFFAQLAGVMTDDGVLVFTLTAPIGYWSPEPAAYVNSIVLPLERVFPDVMLTFSAPLYCFAARRRGVLVADGEVLAARYRSRGVESPWFDPLWFEGASDLLDAAKRAATRRSLAAQPPALANTDERPAAALYHVRYWLAQSASAHASADAPARHRADVLGALADLRFDWAMGAVLAATAAAAVAGLARGRAALRRTAVAWSVGTTGFASMALEIVLLYTFQTLYGYVYGMVGLVIGVFMFGLVLGSLLMNRRLGRPTTGAGGAAGAGGEPPRYIDAGGAAGAQGAPGLRTLVGLDLALAVFAAAMVLVLAALRMSAAEWPVEVATFALVSISGLLGGLVFPLAAAVSVREHGLTGRAAGAVDAADHAGACLGALATGTLLVPVLGVSGACLVVVGLKAMSALLVGGATLVIAPRGESPYPPRQPSARRAHP